MNMSESGKNNKLKNRIIKNGNTKIKKYNKYKWNKCNGIKNNKLN